MGVGLFRPLNPPLWPPCQPATANQFVLSLNYKRRENLNGRATHEAIELLMNINKLLKVTLGQALPIVIVGVSW